MKLSAAIELALRSGKYNVNDEFMCHVLTDMNQGEHVEALQDMVFAINPNSRRGAPLTVALHENPDCVFDYTNTTHRVEFAFTKQFYCWYVFDLKRKGL